MNALNSHWTRCDLSGKGITSLSAEDFDGLPNLRRLFLSDNQLSSLPEDIFDGLLFLRTVNVFRGSPSSYCGAFFGKAAHHPAVDGALVAKVREYLASGGSVVKIRWKRVLMAFGAEDYTSEGLSAMTLAEAEDNMCRGWGDRWR